MTIHKRNWQVKINVKEIDSLTNKVESINLFGNQGMITIFLLRREILCTGMQGAVLNCTRVINDGMQTQVTTPSKWERSARVAAEEEGYGATTHLCNDDDKIKAYSKAYVLLAWNIIISAQVLKCPSESVEVCPPSCERTNRTITMQRRARSCVIPLFGNFRRIWTVYRYTHTIGPCSPCTFTSLRAWIERNNCFNNTDQDQLWKSIERLPLVIPRRNHWTMVFKAGLLFPQKYPPAPLRKPCFHWRSGGARKFTPRSSFLSR